jgi:hypothetical protein
VGGGTNPRAPRLASGVAGAVTVGVDPDPGSGAEFRGITEVDGPFDLVLILEVIEHLPLADGIELLREIATRMAPGGTLVVSTPNVFCPGRFLRDATHVTPFSWDELGATILLSGLSLEGLFRVVPGSGLRRLGKAVLMPLTRALGLDHAPSIAAVARPLQG